MNLTILYVSFYSLLLLHLFFFVWTCKKRSSISAWGRRNLLLLFSGLLLCILAVFRDGYVQSVMHTMDANQSPGLFEVHSIIGIFAGVLGFSLLLIPIISMFFKKQKSKMFLHFCMIVIVVLKVLVIELARMSV